METFYMGIAFGAGVSAQAKFVEQESIITLNANGGYLGSGYMGMKTEIEVETEKGSIRLHYLITKSQS